MKRLVSVDHLTYTTSPLHAYLDEHATRPEGPNIGRRGEHLTITFLSCNRVDLSLRLLQSINDKMPDFAGEVLIFDNGSSGSTIEVLQDFINSTNLRVRLIQSATNLGIARGRNRAIEEVSTSWVMSLDNDNIFIGDPRLTIQKEIAQLGCKFLSLALLNRDGKTYAAFGGHLHMHSDEKNLLAVSGGGSFLVNEPTPDIPPTIGTFLFGTACIFEVAAFHSTGGFDEALFVGFEDTDLSIRLFRMGMKVGCSSAAFLVHDHPQSSEAELDYEKTRFSRMHIEAAAKYMEKKHGYSFWNAELLKWLDTKMPSGRANIVQQSRHKVALLIDVEGCALDNIAKQLRRHLAASFDFEVFAVNHLHPGALASLLTGFDLVHFLARDSLATLWSLADAGVAFAGWPIAGLMADIEKRSAISFGVYDHLYHSTTDISRYNLDPHWYGVHVKLYQRMFNSADGYYVCSKRLFDVYSSLVEFPPPEASLPDGVDLSLFRRDRPIRQGGPLLIGWAGNSGWMDHQGDLDPKGLRTILRPAINQLLDEGLSVELALADRQVRLISYTQMPRFYNSLDVFVCSSESEGTPNPVLEAMACGVPVLSTDVGIVSEAFGPLQRQFILRDRSVHAFAAALRNLYADQRQRELLGQENLVSIQAWNWTAKAADIGSFFKKMISKKERGNQRAVTP